MSDHIHIKIPWQAKVTTTSSATELSLIPASAYLNAIELLCHECNECIVTTNDEGFARVLDMPSTYWRELADLWICHREEYKIVPEAEALLKPRIRQLLVSTSHLFVHPDQLRMDQLQVDKASYGKGIKEDKEEEDCKMDLKKALVIAVGVKIQDGNATSWWLPISCRACKAPLGIARLDNVDVINEVKLDKWAVTIRNNVSCDNQDYVQPCSFIQYFAIDLVELGKAHAGYRVLIQEQTTKQTRIMIWVLNWSTRLLTNTAQPVMNKQAGDTNDIVEYWEDLHEANEQSSDLIL
ncbi:HECT-like ubiquitin-conjugating enzyme-binding-domain-containing protein [Syncephalis plumigaleata]|nr:HECT-like ubiquitin-conjugating enzyme-binding-domain-containing protein [Syncephalis plumigaleata]